MIRNGVFLLLVLLGVFAEASFGQTWTGHISQHRESYQYTERVCRHRFWSRCYAWRNVRKVGYRLAVECKPGWTHDGDRACIIPICIKGCDNGGTCVRPNVCECPVGFGGATCENAQCPPDAPLSVCKTDPCQVTTCPAFPLATCKANYCGGCFADFYVEDVKVNCNVCRDGSPPVTCDLHPCATVVPARGYICVPNYCGCNCGFKLLRLCPNDSSPDECLVDPCVTKFCPSKEVCVSNSCGKCEASCVGKLTPVKKIER